MIQIKNLKAWYKKNEFILKDININIDSGLIFGLLGVNGAGKTTFLNCLTGIHNKFEGEIYLNNDNFIKNPIGFKRNRYFIPDYPILFEEMSGFNYIEFVHNLYKKYLNLEKLYYYCELFSFNNYINKKIQTLSLGNKQKIAIICGLLLDTPLLILDEPLVGLDIVSIDNFYKEMKNYVKRGNSIIFSSHLIEVINSVCDKVAILDEGRIKKIITINEDTNIKTVFFKVTKNEYE
ncbi:ATP-binding cassette domain-containing protein [Tepidibacter thalassicus]|uniref:ABC-2 type transport system ATP-binding protein n=1 Tax=Tepidibacter thalassicus DSM 15285 TaxID=1123350 RepID=A0A1M5SVU5_9FIRM|nr:ABC transporter ATP-binding protein [Tepidibacter thalassicus]SHH42113.1 ABC-2 type transport system ATP-binding protein [Tepidibacter thalassicus DSM 15285]